MAIFGDLAVELQEAIWELALPACRGVHWVEVDGIPHDPEFIRDSIRMTQWCRFDRIPETYSDVSHGRLENPEFGIRVRANEAEDSGPFLRHLLTTVPSVFGKSGPGEDSDQLQDDLADEIAYTSRCRQLSTYYQITTLLSLCQLSRKIARRYIRDNSRKCGWRIRRSMGMAYRPRPMEVWEAQYRDKNPPVSRNFASWQTLRPRIHALDLVVFRLHDSQGRATSLLKHAPWQYWIEQYMHESTFACFDRVGIEWHPSWGSVGGRGELRPGNVQAFIRTMVVSHFPVTLYWLVDGVPRPDWNRPDWSSDYPTVVRDIFARRIAHRKDAVLEHLNEHWKLEPKDYGALLADHHLGQEFEANGRRYYVVFVVCDNFDKEDEDELNKAGLGRCGPFPGSAALWPEALREPVRHAHDINREGWANLGTYRRDTYILSWEPIK